MRILQIIHQYLPEHIGGTELYTQWLSHGLIQKGHTVHIFRRLSAVGHGLNSYEDEAGVTIWSVWHGEFAPVPRFQATFKDTVIEEAFLTALEQAKPDLVHIEHLMGLPVGIVHILQERGIPYVITLHDYWWVCANGQLITNYSNELCDGPEAYINCARCVLARSDKKWLRLALPGLPVPLARRNHLLAQILEQAARLIIPTEFGKNWYAQHDVDVSKIDVIPHGLAYPQISRTGQRDENSPFKIGYIGGLSSQKGVHVLLEAFRELPPGSALFIAGDMTFDPAYVNQLQALATSNVTFLGKLPRDEIWQLLSELDVVVVTSVWYETFCFVISEAFVCGVPVVASDLGVLSERVRDGEDGLLVSPGDAAALCEALVQLQQDPMLLARLQSGILPVKTFQEYVDEIEGLYVATMKA